MSQATKKGYHKGCFGSDSLAGRRESSARRFVMGQFRQQQARRKLQMKRQRELAELRAAVKRLGWFRRMVYRFRAWLKRVKE